MRKCSSVNGCHELTIDLYETIKRFTGNTNLVLNRNPETILLQLIRKSDDLHGCIPQPRVTIAQACALNICKGTNITRSLVKFHSWQLARSDCFNKRTVG